MLTPSGHQRLAYLAEQLLPTTVASKSRLGQHDERLVQPAPGNGDFTLFQSNQQHGWYSGRTKLMMRGAKRIQVAVGSESSTLRNCSRSRTIRRRRSISSTINDEGSVGFSTAGIMST